LPRNGIVVDEWEPPTQLNGGRQFAVSVKDVTNGRGIFFGHDKHTDRMGWLAKIGKE
jgi:hypothetical protein